MGLWHCVCYQLINHAYLSRSLTILFFLYTSRRVDCFSTPQITDATSGGGAKKCACFYGVSITNSRYTRNVFIKPGCFIDISCIPYSFGLTHQEWREVRETAYSMDQNGDHIPRYLLPLGGFKHQTKASASTIFAFCYVYIYMVDTQIPHSVKQPK